MLCCVLVVILLVVGCLVGGWLIVLVGVREVGLGIRFFCAVCGISAVMVSVGLLFLYYLNALGLFAGFGFLYDLLMCVCVVCGLVVWIVDLRCFDCCGYGLVETAVGCLVWL